jgi:hypothetical protein
VSTSTLDDVFGDLDFDDLEEEVAQVSSENVWDRHDRLKSEMEAAQAAAEAARDSWFERKIRVSPSYFNRSTWALLARNLDNLEDRDMDRATRYFNGDVEGMSGRQVAEHILSMVRRDREVLLAETESQQVYAAAKDEAEKAGFPVGSVVAFKTTKGQSNHMHAEGVVREVTTANYIVTIDKQRSDYDMREQDTARIKIARATKSAWSGGREMVLVWGPSSASAYQARMAEEARKAREEQRRNAAAQNAWRAAQAKWSEVQTSWADYEQAQRAVVGNAAAAALQVLIQRHQDEMARLVAEKTNTLTANLRVPNVAKYERPSNRWQDYLEGEQA